MSDTQLRHFRRLAQYNAWFNQELYQRVDGLDEELRRRDLGAFFGSIHGTLGHILLADRLWLARFARPAPGNVFHFESLQDADLVWKQTDLAHELYADWRDLWTARKETDGVLRRFVHEMRDEWLDSDFHYENSKGIAFTAPLWHTVAHLFNHQTHHRGQVTTLLAQQGVDVGPTDYIIVAHMPEETP